LAVVAIVVDGSHPRVYSPASPRRPTTLLMISVPSLQLVDVVRQRVGRVRALVDADQEVAGHAERALRGGERDVVLVLELVPTWSSVRRVAPAHASSASVAAPNGMPAYASRPGAVGENATATVHVWPWLSTVAVVQVPRRQHELRGVGAVQPDLLDGQGSLTVLVSVAVTSTAH
jgi:hypothetical protein